MSETPWSDLLMQRPGPRCLGPGIAVLMALSLVKVLYSGGILERRNVKEAMHAAIETVWPSNKVISSTSSEASPCFVRTGHVCSHGEGIGGLFRRMEWVIAIATRYHCAYVCHEADWPTGGHGTGNVGHLFGCSSNVTGDPSRVVAATAIKGLTTARVQLKYDGSPHYVLRYKYGQPLLRSSAWYVDPPQAQVWELNPPCREIFTVTHETTWRWIQQQFHFVRTAMGRSATAWGDDDDDDADDADSRARRPGRRRRLRIALQLRRGDRPAACPLYLYLNALRDLSIALPWISVETTKILLIGQVNVTSEEFTCLKRLEAEILVVKNPKADVAPVALQSDLDHISSSDVLILGGGGSFTWLAATLQWRGIILHSQTKDSALDGLPHAYALDDTGRFPCNSSYNFSDYFAARPLDRSSGGSKFREQVELAMQDYMRWYEEAKPCEGPRGRDGFGIGRRCKPPVFSPACETTTASPCPSTAPTVPSPAAAVPNRATVPPSRWVNVTAALYPLDSRYVASSKACPAACLGKPGKDCEKRYCCKAKGSADTFETLSYEHVAFLRIRCQGNINHDFHQSFWPFFWWTAVYNNSDFAILVDRMAKHPNTSCPAAYWLDDLFWALSKANGWKVHNFSSTKEYCITGELHILEGLRNCCDYRLKPSALLRFAAPHFTFAVLGQLDQEYHRKALIYSRGLSSSWRRIRRPEDLRPLLRKDLDVEILADLPSTLVAQARLFASNGLVLAPNGGWAPNVIFMPLDSCLIELHLYQLDSWVQRYLLYSTIGEVLLIVGDYRDPEKKKIVRPKRIGGDDDFLVRGAKNNLYEDIYNEMARSHLCNAYLAK